MSEPFAVINGQAFYKGDWVADIRIVDVKSPSVIDNVTKEDGETTVWIRSPLFEFYQLTMGEFAKHVIDGVFVRMEKPKYHVGEKFYNRFTTKSIEIIDVPRMRNEESGEYVYFVLEFTPTFGYNHDARTEHEITNFYVSEGAELT